MSFERFTPADFITAGAKARKISRIEPSTATLLDDLSKDQPIEVHGLIQLIREVLAGESSEIDSSIAWRLSVDPAFALWFTPLKTEVLVEVVRYEKLGTIVAENPISVIIRQIREAIGNYVDQDQLRYVATVLSDVTHAKCHGLVVSNRFADMSDNNRNRVFCNDSTELLVTNYFYQYFGLQWSKP
jgi:hypothetical protein